MQDKAFIREVRRRVVQLEEAYERLSREIEAARVFLSTVERDSLDIGNSHKRRTHTQIATDVIASILADGKSKHRSEILELLTDRGVHIGGSKPVNSVSALMSPDDRFSSIGGGRWLLSAHIDDTYGVIPYIPKDDEDEEDEEDENGQAMFNGPEMINDRHKQAQAS